LIQWRGKPFPISPGALIRGHFHKFPPSTRKQLGSSVFSPLPPFSKDKPLPGAASPLTACRGVFPSPSSVTAFSPEQALSTSRGPFFFSTWMGDFPPLRRDSCLGQFCSPLPLDCPPRKRQDKYFVHQWFLHTEVVAVPTPTCCVSFPVQQE